MFSGLPPKADLPVDLRTTPAASSSRMPPSRPRASPRSRASACDHSQGVPSGASFSPWRSAFARTDLLRSLVSTRGSRWVSADLEQLFVRHAPSRAVAISWTALAATPLTPALSQRFAQLIQCDWRSCKHQKRDAYSKLHARGERPSRRRAPDERDELAPLHATLNEPRPHRQETSVRNLLAVGEGGRCFRHASAGAHGRSAEERRRQSG